MRKTFLPSTTSSWPPLARIVFRAAAISLSPKPVIVSSFGMSSRHVFL
jgi:hypothetical protein